MDINVGILAIGNEVVEGQITNRNGSWLAQEVERIGCSPLFHLSCRDQDDEIQQALQFLNKSCQLIIVSGGLGPTQDDFTRQSLSRFAGQPLELNKQEWAKIEQRLKARDLTIREPHKNQAYFPEGSQILDNEKGIAPGFLIKMDDLYLASLPGPPNELHWMYTNQLEPLILSLLKPKRSKKLYTWVCLGAPESEIAHIVESLIGTQFEVGFRLHKPYVEVKVWAPEQLDVSQIALFKTLSDKLSPWFVADKISTIRSNLTNTLNEFSKIFVIDQISTGLFIDKLKEGVFPAHMRYQCFEQDGFRFFKKEEILNIIKAMNVKSNELVIALFPASETSAICYIGDEVQDIQLPRKISVRSKVGQSYVIEHCFLKLIQRYKK